MSCHQRSMATRFFVLQNCFQCRNVPLRMAFLRNFHLTVDQKRKESAIFGQPLPNPKSKNEDGPHRMPRTLNEWKLVASWTWTDYKSTWEGFLVPKEKEQEGTIQKDEEELIETIEQKKKSVKENVSKNLDFVQEEGTYWKNKVQDETGIHSGEDLKRWAGEQMKLATECLSEFMAGYRTGRDKEIDRMLHEYFQENEQQEEKPKRKRRKPKRRELKRR